MARGGAVVDGHDPADHAAAAAPLLADQRVRDEASRAAVAHARRYGWERTTDAMVDLYADVLSAAADLAIDAGPRDACGA